MKKSDTFFLVHNYNTVPKELIEYCNDYLIIDCSDDGKTPDELKAAGYNFIHVENTGHNLTSYFHYFIDNYDNLPEHMPDYNMIRANKDRLMILHFTSLLWENIESLLGSDKALAAMEYYDNEDFFLAPYLYTDALLHWQLAHFGMLSEEDKKLFLIKALYEIIDVRIRSEVTSINRVGKFVTVRNNDGSEYEETYDELVIATGSSPLRPPIPGIDSDGIYTLWNVNDTDRIRKIVDDKRVKSAAVIGGGFIGLEMAENLHARGLRVSIIEAMYQVMAPIDWEMAQLLHRNIRANGTALYLGDGVKSFSSNDGIVTITLASGKEIKADMVILSIGVRANSHLAKEAGLLLNNRGGIIVSDTMQTNDEHIWAVGDAVEITRFGSDEKAMIALAGPANKQGRIVADYYPMATDMYIKLIFEQNGKYSVPRSSDLTASTKGSTRSR